MTAPIAWTGHATNRTYVRATISSVRPAPLAFLLALALVAAFVATAGSAWWVTVVVAVVYLVFASAVVLALGLVKFVRLAHLSRTRVLRYELTADHLVLGMGDDEIRTPRSSLHLIRSGPDFVALSRSGFAFRTTILFFDDPATAALVSEQLR